MDKTPNHICKNPHCHNGDDGGRKHYWACNDCDKRNSWKKAACSEACYVEYLDAIAVSRGETSAELDGQNSLFDDEAVTADEQIVPDEPAPAVEPARSESAPFMGYHSKKKNKHR